MAIIKPFKGIRPSPDKVHLVVSRSVDSYSAAQLNNKLTENQYSFLHIIKPDSRNTDKSKPNSPELLHKIKKRFLQFVHDGILTSDSEESFYIYHQIKESNVFAGIIGCASIWDYFNNVIKKHEQTITEREEKLKNYLEVCNFNAEPVCLCYPDNDAISKIISDASSKEPTYDFFTSEKTEHKLWKVSDKKNVGEIISAFKKIPSIYIADGHHRIASSALLGKTCKEKNKNYSGNEPCNFFMAAFFSESNIKIHDYNRVVKDLNFLRKDVFIKQLAEKFFIEEKGINSYKPNKPGNFSLYIEGQWYSLTLKNSKNDKLDSEVLTEFILSPVLAIHDLRTDKRISFVNGEKGMDELKIIVDSGKAMAAFGLFPVTIHDIIRISDSGGTMPPKSTWVEPKLRNGLVVYSLSDTTL